MDATHTEDNRVRLNPSSRALRRCVDYAMKLLSGMAALVGIFALAWILYEVITRGYKALDWHFFSKQTMSPGNPEGGMANAIVGTLKITALATLIGVPTGLLAGTYLSEFGKSARFAHAIRFTSNLLMGVPSIIIGMFVYVMLVLRTGFSGYAGSVALAIIMLPVVARTSEDIMSLVPNALRESALALGAPRWKVTIQVVFRAAKAGLLTGCLLAVARVSGETAPLLFTAMNNFYWSSMSEQTANLTVTIFNYAMSPFDDWQEMAWGASLLIMAGVLSVTILSRVILEWRKRT